MKALIFTTQIYLLGGAERLAVEIAEDLNKRAIHTDLLSMYTGDNPGVAKKTQELLFKGIPAVHFLDLNINPSFVSIILAVLKLRRLIKLNGYDIVETSQFSPTIIAAWATKFTKTKHVAGLHYRETQKGVDKKRTFLFIISARLNLKTRYYGVSRFIVGFWLRRSSIFIGRIRHIYNSINDIHFSAVPDKDSLCRELMINIDSRIILFVGRLDIYKGFETILEALAAILLKENLVLLFVGHDDPSAKEIVVSMGQKIAHEKLSDHVRFLGRRDDIPRLMASSDVLAHPTRTEAFGLVLAEAMAAGLPIVASDVDGIPEVLADTDSIMISPDDPDALRESILNILSWPPEKKLIAIEKGKCRAEYFRMENRTNAMHRLFQDVLKQHF